jgi:Mrp family chromosome partitioning ATPase
MLKLVVVDRSAESRHRIVGEINRLLSSNLPDLAFVPRINVTPLSPHEVGFHGAPDICVVGEEIGAGCTNELGDIRRALPETPILVRLAERAPNVAVVEQLARLGADDIVGGEITPAEFLAKVILVVRKRGRGRHGRLIVVDGGKGGVGVTTVAAALGDAFVAAGRRVALWDFDVESQDLSRFLQVRPYVNENLQALFDQQRPVTEDFVSQCAVPVWADSELRCITPIAETDNLYAAHAAYSRILVSLLEVFDGLFDCLVVDVGSARGAMLKVLYQAADTVVFVVTPDPAGLFSGAERLRRAKAALSPAGEVVVLENSLGLGGLSRGFFRTEFARAAGLDDGAWCAEAVPLSVSAGRWAGSGETFYTLGGKGVARAFDGVARRLGLVEGTVNAWSGVEASSRAALERAVTVGRAVFSRITRRSQAAVPTRVGVARLPQVTETKALEYRASTSVVGEILDPRTLVSGLTNS